MKIKIKKLHPDAKLPTTQDGDAGFDLYAVEDVLIPCYETKKIRTGIAIQLPPHTFAKIEDRSSMAIKSLRTGAGIVDESFTGEIQVVMHYLGTNGAFDTGYQIKKGDKIAQFIVHEYMNPAIVEVTGELKSTNRGTKGWGSTDI